MALSPAAAIDLWRHRYWRPDAQRISQLSNGRPAIVVTGASEGIGLALAHAFAATGQPLLMIARREEPLALAAHAVTERRGVASIPLPLDITRPDAAEVIAGALGANGLYADILINNAGIGLGGPFETHSPEAIAALLALNVTALTSLTRRFLPDMCVRGRGGVLNVASLGGYAPGPYQAAYYASKAYVISLTRALAFETRGQGVRVAVLSPGPVATRFHDRMGADHALYRYLVRGMTPEAVARSAWRGWRWGAGAILPGLDTLPMAIAMRVVPDFIVTPIIGTLLYLRRGPGK